MFNHLLLPELPKIKQVNSDNGRRYETTSGLLLPSITTILSKSDPKKETALANWRKNIGHEKAKAITQNSASRGTSLDKMVETYLNNETIDHDNEQATKMFGDLLPFVERINNIHYLQPRLFSERLGTAGTADIIAEYDEKLCVIDIKNARRTRTEEQVWTYFLQITAYACMYNEMSPYSIKNGIIMMAVEDRPTQIFEFKIADYIAPLLNAISTYNALVL